MARPFVLTMKGISMRYAYIAGGQLHLKQTGSPAQSYESAFGKTLRQQREDTQRQRAWQKKSMVSGMAPPSLLQRLTEQEPPALPVSVAGVCSGGDGLFFALQAAEVGGFLTLDPTRKAERRLFHTAEFHLEHLSHSAELGLVACTIARPDGSRHIGVMRESGNRPDEYTEGEGSEMAPSWVPGAGRRLVFQAAGVARNAEGFVQDRTAYTVDQLDLESGEITTLAAEEGYDLLAPRVLPDGTLLCIRRPRKIRRVGFLWILWGVVAMPFLLVYAMGKAFFAWCNFFTWRHTGQELTQQLGTGGANAPKNVKAKPMQAWGEWLTPQDMPAGRHQKLADAPAAWVPADWKLVRRPASGGDGTAWETLASAVLTYDVTPAGDILYTDGGTLWLRTSGGETQKLDQQAAISGLAVLSEPAEPDTVPTEA